MIQLNEWGFGPQLGMKIYQTYRTEAIELLTENPYRLIEDIDGVGFYVRTSLVQNWALPAITLTV